MSLADELLADLEEGGEELDYGYRDNENAIEEAMEVPEVEESDVKSVGHVAKLRDGKELNDVLNGIEKFSSSTSNDRVMDSEYQLIVEANNLTVEIDNEINIIHKFLRDLYSKRFPELESLIPNALDYIRTVELLGNDLEAMKVDLTDILAPATKMVVSVTASTTQGEKLEEEEVGNLMEACKMADDLLEAKVKIFKYVESRMTFIAPNLSIIVGAPTAAKLMGSAGGLTGLSKMPACNVLLLGSQKRTLSGFSSTVVLPHTGYIYFSEIVQDLPPDLRKKAARMIAAKCSLAARVDSFQDNSDGTLGQQLRNEVEKKLEKWQEPPQVKEAKALPRPDDTPRKKRGGRRVRKMKEKFAVTEMRRQANRLEFGSVGEDLYQTDLGFSVGTLGRKESGRVRNPVVDKKTQVSISKRLQRSMQQSQVYGGQSTVRKTVSGTSTVAFTPMQGLEIVNPGAAEKKAVDGNTSYFSSTAGFLKVNKK